MTVENLAAQIADPVGDGCICQSCGKRSTGDLLVPDDVWVKITPKPQQPGAGILCPNCIVQRITSAGIWSALRASDVDAGGADDRILWGVVANAGRLSDQQQPRWSHVSDATGLGSTSSVALCRRFDFDPDELRGGTDLAEEERS